MAQSITALFLSIIVGILLVDIKMDNNPDKIISKHYYVG